ncbi:MAG: SDR family NAD(P)-dependent oxidoreductase [Candidatus Korarchaeota archaeon NZ13-K]|nr:MAG: SDR family NAD(P)-dependent oxidoreductase [Candidatus Korarchaeota archaeon NZ13-K]
MLLEGKVALITGGTSGIGLATAELFMREGALISIVGRDRGKGEAALRALGGGRVSLHLGDVSREEEARRLVDEVVDRWGRIDILVNAAGVFRAAPLTELSVEDWDHVINVNLRGTFLMTKFSLPHMGDSIVNVSSIAGISPYPRGTAYCSAKAAVIAFSKALALELADKGIRVNAVVPGLVDTPMLRGIAGSEERFRSYSSLVPMGRVARAEEVARAILYLASPLSSYVTGAVLVIDGGITAGRMTTAGSLPGPHTR